MLSQNGPVLILNTLFERLLEAYVKPGLIFEIEIILQVKNH